MKISTIISIFAFYWLVSSLPMYASLKGVVSIDENTRQSNDLQAEIDIVVPTAPSRFVLHTNEHNLVSDIPVDQFVQPKIAPRQTIMVRLSPKRHELSAIGIQWDWDSGRIVYVDPASSIATKIRPGDQVLTIDGADRRIARNNKLNYGTSGSYVEVGFLTRERRALNLLVLRQPVRNFTPYFQKTLLPY